MNILFLSVMDLVSLDESSIYTDILREFVNRGHHVDIISPIEKRSITCDKDISHKGFNIYKTHVGNITNTGFIEKGISIIKYRRQIVRCIREKVANKKIDLFLVAVPPVTVDAVVAYVKKTYGCKVYLLLKDIWPASMYDLKTIGGPIVKKIVCAIFRVWEKKLYRLSDSIGCLSPANVTYICEHNAYLNPKKIHVNPNSIKSHTVETMSVEEKKLVREKYGIPTNKIIFIYGGTLGVGQNVPHIVECLKVCKEEECHFVISGKGVQYYLLEQYRDDYKPDNLTLINGLPKTEYDKLMQSCDIGMVFLRYSAQTPNIPSRILSYMDYSLPILACTDPVSDLNQIIESGGFGWGCLSNNPDEFKKTVRKAILEFDNSIGIRAKEYLSIHFSEKQSCDIVLNIFNGEQ